MNNIKYTESTLSPQSTSSNSMSKDVEKPYSFGDWMKNSTTLSLTYQEYMKYLSEWTVNKSVHASTPTTTESYISYLKQLTFKHTFTDEELRFLNTVDLTNKHEADVAANLYSKRLKEILGYIRGQRHESKNQPTKMQHHSTIAGVAKVIYNDILRLLDDLDFQTEYKDVLDDFDRMYRELRVELVELYDVEDGYTGTSGIDPESVNYKRSETYNTIDYDPHIFIDTSSAISNIVSQYDITSNIQVNNTNISINFDSQQTSLVELLPPHEFIDYNNDVTSLELKLDSMRNLIRRSTGADTYYIKTGEDATVESAGLLFNSDDKTSNIYNKQKPHVNYVSNDDTNTKTIHELGGFFTPERLGVLSYTSFTPTITVDKTRLESNTIYTYPDASVIGDTLRDSTTPLVYDETVSWQKRLSSDGLLSDVNDQTNYQKFYNYISSDEYNKFSTQGVSRKDDKFDFWQGDLSDIWSNDDVFETSDTLELPIESRQQSQLTNSGQVYKWQVDIYGNEYALLKNMISYDESGFDILECDKDKYQDSLTCRVFDGFTFSDILKGISIYDECVDGGSNISLDDISDNLQLLQQTSMTCNGGVCPLGSRWDEVSADGDILNHADINGFSSPPDYTDLTNCGYFLSTSCLDEDEEESLKIHNCNIRDGYTIKIPTGYVESDIYELTASHYGVNESPTFSAQSGTMFNPPYDDMWDCGDFQDTCDDVPLGVFYDMVETARFDSELYDTVPTATQETHSASTVSGEESRSSTPGRLVIRNNNSEYIGSHENFMGEVISSLPEEYMMVDSDDRGFTEYNKTYNPRHDMLNDLIDFDIINDIMILKSTKFVYVVKIRYSYETGKVSVDNTRTLLIGLDYKSVYIRHFYSEKENTLMLGVYDAPPIVTSINPLPIFSPKYIYTIPVNQSDLVFSKLKLPTTGYVLPVDVSKFTPTEGLISYNEQLKLYYITSIGRLFDNVYGDRVFVYQSRFSTAAPNSSDITNFAHNLYYTHALDLDQTETLRDIYGVETLSQDDRGFSYYNLNEYLNDSYLTS